ncbi:DUF559 domain-containing protein [Nocardioides panzhihuensis]|uniref:DUF559 domain-containing protein n=1 Tax=Nocardioides panzhihuensis TaxID=860243 RepID=A0A7Z0DMC7_9ACTN|nr:hypothetical protein [Nocardioides panzhihuensis]
MNSSPSSDAAPAVDLELDEAPFDPSRPFTRKRALASGITPNRLRGPGFVRLHTGVYVAADVELTPLIRAEAALTTYADTAFASHATAARIAGLPLPALPGEHVTVMAQKDRHRITGVVCHCAPKGQVKTVGGVRVSMIEQNFVELATLLSLVDLVVVGDYLLRKNPNGLARLQRYCAKAAGPGAAAARRALAYVRTGVDSPMETRLRMLIVLAGLPEPMVNQLVGEESELDFRKYDMCWPSIKLIVEYDGRQHVEREEQWESDIGRREKIDDDGWRILVFIAKDIYNTPGRTLDRIHRQLVARRLRGVPAQLSPQWQLHFPGRPDSRPN